MLRSSLAASSASEKDTPQEGASPSHFTLFLWLLPLTPHSSQLSQSTPYMIADGYGFLSSLKDVLGSSPHSLFQAPNSHLFLQCKPHLLHVISPGFPYIPQFVYGYRVCASIRLDSLSVNCGLCPCANLSSRV